MADQRRLFGDAGLRPPQLGDFALLPDRVWPTKYSILEQGGGLLFYRNADAVKLIPPKHHTINLMLRRLGEPCRHCGEVPDIDTQVVVATGQEGVTYDRQIAIYDHLRNMESLRLAERGEIPARVRDWFIAREGRR